MLLAMLSRTLLNLVLIAIHYFGMWKPESLVDLVPKRLTIEKSPQIYAGKACRVIDAATGLGSNVRSNEHFRDSPQWAICLQRLRLGDVQSGTSKMP